MKVAVENIQMAIGSGSLIVLQKTFDRLPDFADVDLPIKLQTMVKSPEDWRKEVESAIETLATAMQEDLDRTL